jgi:hypothetical protein
LLLIAIVVMNVEVEVLSADSVRVSWDSVKIPQPSLYLLRAYVVNYSPIEQESGGASMKTVPIFVTSAHIEGLAYNFTYQFQVLVSVDIKGEVFLVPDVPTVARIVVQTQAAPATTAIADFVMASTYTSTPPNSSPSSIYNSTLAIMILGGLNGLIVLAAICSIVLVYCNLRCRRYVNYVHYITEVYYSHATLKEIE